MLLGTMVAVAGLAKSPTPEALAPFLRWHCSDSNGPRYDGPVVLPRLPFPMPRPSAP
jgi:hypothetical protein